MGYYIRAFCAKHPIPTIGELFDAAEKTGIDLQLDARSKDKQISDHNWSRCSVLYDTNRRSFELEITQPPEELFAAEIAQFLKEVSELNPSPGRRQVLEWIARTKFIVSIQVATTDINDLGRNAYGAVLRYLFTHNDALIQADGEGFYECEQLIIPLGW